MRVRTGHAEQEDTRRQDTNADSGNEDSFSDEDGDQDAHTDASDDHDRAEVVSVDSDSSEAISGSFSSDGARCHGPALSPTTGLSFSRMRPEVSGFHAVARPPLLCSFVRVCPGPLLAR